MALPNTNISTTLVGNTIGSGSRDVGTLCTHPNINKWSRWKPVRYPSVTGLTAGQLNDVKCGLNMPTFSTINDLITHYRSFDNNEYKFEYLKPRGGSVTPAEPYRLGDFRGYDHQADIWYGLTGFRSYFFTAESSADFYIIERFEENNIKWQFLEMQGYRFGAVIVTENTLDNQRVGLGSNPFSDPVVHSAIVPIDGLPVGRYDIFVFAFLMSGGNPQHYVPLENGFLGVTTIKQETMDVEMTGIMERNVARWNVRWGLTIDNFAIYPQILENCTIELRYSTSTPGSTLRTGERRLVLGSVNIPAEDSYVDGGEFTSALDFIPVSENQAYLYFSNTTNPNLNGTFGMITPNL